jgi:hypothetical protein
MKKILIVLAILLIIAPALNAAEKKLKPEEAQKEIKNTEKLLEESIEDYLNNNKIIGIIKLSEKNTMTFASTKDIMEATRKKKIARLERKFKSFIFI